MLTNSELEVSFLGLGGLVRVQEFDLKKTTEKVSW